VAKPNITSVYSKAIRDIQILSSYVVQASNLEAKYQYVVSEVVMLRLFSIMETSIGEIALRLACGSPYRNGNAPALIHQCTSINDAIGNMISLSRTRRQRLRFLKWTNENDIKHCIQFVLNTNDKFFTEIQNNSAIIEEMRFVRNHIAHRNSDTAKKYYTVLSGIYNANIRISLGAFLTSKARHTQSNIEKYILTIPIILDDITKG